MKPLKFHLFVCTNERPPGHPRGCCKEKNSEVLVQQFKQELRKAGLDENVRAQRAGCLDTCEQGPSVVVYPDGIWYRVQNLSDVQEIIQSHLMSGIPVERLKMVKQKQTG